MPETVLLQIIHKANLNKKNHVFIYFTLANLCTMSYRGTHKYLFKTSPTSLYLTFSIFQLPNISFSANKEIMMEKFLYLLDFYVNS